MENLDILFNSHKMKYKEMSEFFNFIDKKERTFYCCFDMDYFMSKYLYAIDYYNEKDMKISEEMTNKFLSGFLNIIAHYKRYFYNHCDSLSFFYIFLNKKRYEKDKEIFNMLKKITKLIMMIPRLYICFYETDEQGFFLKYNLIKTILITKQKIKETIFLDFSKGDKTELFYKLTKNFYQFKFDNYQIYLYGFDQFKSEYMSEVDDIYINSILSLMTVYYILDEIKINKSVRINDIMLKFIQEHIKEDFNNIKVKLLLLKKFTKLQSLTKKLKKLEYNLNNPMYSQMIRIIMDSWKHTVKDNNIYNINEILHIPQDDRINIELLMKY